MQDLEQIIAQQMQQPGAPMVIAQPINDVQLVALVASHHMASETPAEAVAWAFNIVTEACVVMHGNALARAVQARLQGRKGNGLVTG